MFCPKCAAQNVDGARFCRACGTDIVALLRQMTGQLPGGLTGEVDEATPTAEHSRRAPANIAEHVFGTVDSMFEAHEAKPAMRRQGMAPAKSSSKKVGEEAIDDGLSDQGRKQKEGLESGIRALFFGLGFLCVALSIGRFMPSGRYWWFWMLIPTFTFIGSGIAQIMSARAAQQEARLAARPTTLEAIRAAGATTALPIFDRDRSGYQPPRPRQTSEVTLTPPASVTEGTTKLLDREGL